MIYISYGMRKSGSTLAFELTRRLLEVLGHPQDRLSDDIIDPARKINFLDDRQLGSEEIFGRLQEAVPEDRIVVFKTHAPPRGWVERLAGEGRLLAQAIFRDPRDNVLSLLDAGERCKQRGRGSFAEIQDLDSAIADCEKNVITYQCWCGLPDALTSNYEEVAFRGEAFLRRVLDQIGLTVPDGADLAEIVANVKGQRFTQVNKGVSRRHRDELSLNQALSLTARFRPAIETHMAVEVDGIDRLMFAALSEVDPARLDPEGGQPLPESSGILEPDEAPRARTRKTFVVLGCPRGGTSLLAGALACCGIHMGKFRTKQYEDPDFKIPPNVANTARARLGDTIVARNLDYDYWGWKVPNNIYYIRGIMDLLIAPVFLFVYRDPEAIARSSARHDGRDWDEEGAHLLKVAHRHSAKVREFQAEATREGYECHEFQLENIHRDPGGFADRMLSIVKPLEPERRRLLDFIHPEGGYHPSPRAGRKTGAFVRQMLRRYLPFRNRSA